MIMNNYGAVLLGVGDFVCVSEKSSCVIKKVSLKMAACVAKLCYI